ncbi:hypothetical protein FRC98_13295 [Lujinxingia vulgaris]|uniref:Uncharacterized protein n=1 Tax=Lujinxingia vulgaris TaxID=2600176 RepID=A0A5C6XA70_9DELT|nr:hypothetical protein [Lujinxingia vulgaris]TXD36095.1 hypothetical protein FRC98_13295 [Lujinxingia vulgaris]
MTSSSLDADIRSLPALAQALADPQTSLIILRPDGHWHLEQAGTLSFQNTPLLPATVNRILEHLDARGPSSCLTRWWIQPLPGSPQPFALLTPRPDIALCPLAQNTRELLRPRLSSPINGLIFSPTAPPRQSLLLWLTTRLPRELLLYVSPVPPIAPSSVPLIHLQPPHDPHSRAHLARLAHSASALMWDAPIDAADLPLLYAPHSPSHRWLATDLDLLPARLRDAILPHNHLQIGLRADHNTATITYLASHRPEGWATLLDLESRDLPAEMPSPARSTSEHTSPLTHTHPTRAEISPATILQSGEIDLDALLGDPLDRQATLQNISSPNLQGERLDRALSHLQADVDIDALEIPEVELDQLRQTVESDVALDSLRELRAQSLHDAIDRSDDTTDDTPIEATDEIDVPEAIARLHHQRASKD